MLRTSLVLLILLAASALWAQSAPHTGGLFTDPPFGWADAAVRVVTVEGIMPASEGLATPQQYAEAVRSLVAAGIYDPSELLPADVPPGHWAAVGIEKLAMDAPDVLEAVTPDR